MFNLQEFLDLEKVIDGVIYPYRPGDFESLIKRALNILDVLENIKFNKPGLNHETNTKTIIVRNWLNKILKYGDSIDNRGSLITQVVNAEKWAEALFYNPSDITHLKGIENDYR